MSYVDRMSIGRAPNGPKPSVAAPATLSPVTAGLLSSLAFRGHQNSETWNPLEEANASAAAPSEPAGPRSAVGRLKAAVRRALKPVAAVPLVEALRLRLRFKVHAIKRQAATSADDDLINRATSAAHEGSFDEALRLLQNAARMNP